MDKELLDMFTNANNSPQSKPQPQEQQPQQPKQELSAEVVKYTQDKQLEDQHHDFYRIMAENIRVSQQQRVQIIKGLQADDVEIEFLFLTALDCISKMSKNKHFYDYTKSIIDKRGLFECRKGKKF